MRATQKRPWRLGISAALTTSALSALAQAAEAGESAETGKLEPVVVRGIRASLASSQEIKRDALQIVDSVVADNIDKFPDVSVTDALQRITGVQITRDRGEGTGVTIRGLSQMETTLNGREVFSANLGRSVDFADIPAEMVAGIDVYKTSAAEQLEGGLGGTIDLRTRRPFDFPGHELVGTARVVHGDLVSRSAPQFSALASNRWRSPATGEFGGLLSVAVQRRAFREDQQSTGNPVARTDLIPGQTVIAPNGVSQTTSAGHRDRAAIDGVLQWRPSEALEFYAEATYAELRTTQDSYQINVSASPTFVAGSPSTFDGTGDLKSITWTNAPISVLSFARDTVDQTRQAAVGGSWKTDELTLKGDLSYTRSLDTLFFSGPFMAAKAASFTQDLSTRVPSTVVTGTDLLAPSNFSYTGIAYRSTRLSGDMPAAQFDGEYRLSGGFFTSLTAGLRYARRGATNAPGLIFADAAVSGLTAAQTPGRVQANPYGDFFPGNATPTVQNFLVGNLATARDAAALRSAFGVTAPIPGFASPLGIWTISEDTRSAYLMTRFMSADGTFDGNAGLRAVQTREAVSGGESVPSAGTIVPIDIRSRYGDVLPSLNLRLRLPQGLLLRASASKTLTRPDFSQLSPSLTLIQNSVNPALNQGSAGNPELKPIRSNNLDIAVEAYQGRTTSVCLTGFLKHVDGFVTTVSSPETYGGTVYQVTRPQNSNAGTIRGVELGYQQFYDGLRGWLSGLGLQANYTYVDSETTNSSLGTTVPLQNLSRNSLNLVGMYERNGVSARLAYNWRDRFFSGVTNIVGVGSLPIYTRAYGWLDASLGYRLENGVSFTIAGTNLLGTMRRSYYGTETRPQSEWVGDTQIIASVTFRL